MSYMHFSFITSDGNKQVVRFADPGQGLRAAAQNCWGVMAGGYIRPNEVLTQINWFVEVIPEGFGSQFKTVDEVRQAFEYFFPKDDKYTLDWEITGQFLTDDVNSEKCHWPEVIIKNFGDYPRQLMMSKLFVIRNLSRYGNRIWRELLDKGVEYGVATTLGACVSSVSDLRGKSYTSELYANVMLLSAEGPSTTVADLRNFARNERYLGEIGKPWSKGGGYLRTNEVMRSLIKPTYTNSPTIYSLGITYYNKLTTEHLGDLLYRITGKNPYKK